VPRQDSTGGNRGSGRSRNRAMTPYEASGCPGATTVTIRTSTSGSQLTEGQSYGVYSQNAWRLADMGAKHAFLRAGFGFGHTPMFMVEDDIANDRLRAVRIEMPGNLRLVMQMHAVYRKEAPPGPAGRWLIQGLKRRAGTESSRKIDGAKHKRAARR